VNTAGQSGAGEYDPWLDYNEDGIIDALDLQPLGNAYGTVGDSIKKVNATNLWELDCYYRLSVESIVDSTRAAAGNHEPVTCFLIVSYQGVPVSNLTSANFTITVIRTPIGGPMGGLGFVFEGEAAEGSGVYVINIVPAIPPGQAWVKGAYVFVVNVSAKCVANLNVSPKTTSSNAAKGINSPNLLVS